MKKIVIGLISVTVLGIGGTVLYTTMNNHSNAKQQVTDLKINKSAKKEQSTDDDVKIKDKTSSETKDKASESSQVVDKKNQNKTIVDQLDEVKSLVASINDFQNASNKAYANLEEKFKEYHITLDASVKGPYGIFDPISESVNQSAVLAGITLDTKVAEKDGGYVFTNTVRTGQGNMNGSASRTGSVIRKALKTNEYASVQKEVKYKLELNEAKTEGTLKLVSEQWW